MDKRALIEFLLNEAEFLREWADELTTGKEMGSDEQFAECLDIQAGMFTQRACSLRGEAEVSHD